MEKVWGGHWQTRGQKRGTPTGRARGRRLQSNPKGEGVTRSTSRGEMNANRGTKSVRKGPLKPFYYTKLTIPNQTRHYTYRNCALKGDAGRANIRTMERQGKKSARCQSTGNRTRVLQGLAKQGRMIRTRREFLTRSSRWGVCPPGRPDARLRTARA